MDGFESPPSSAATANGATLATSHFTLNKVDSPAEPASKQIKQLWKFRMRPELDDLGKDWWFASTAIPLLAATTGPLANVMSIAALITSWRNNYDPAYPGQDSHSVGFPDPHWCIALNAASLVCGFVGNIFLLFNFTRRIRYIVALPMTIVLWYLATGILIAIIISVNEFVPPVRPQQTYSQGFWHAIIAASLYLVSSMLLMVNMLGYFLGHYPQHFELSEEQRNLILQTMMFFIWLAGGGGVFARVSGLAFVDALYFCDVTILTVGFGDFHPVNDLGRGLVFPYSVGGIIILGLMVSSIRQFVKELSRDNVVRSHVERRRVRTMERSVTSSFELAERQKSLKKAVRRGSRPIISEPFGPKARSVTFEPKEVERSRSQRRLTSEARSNTFSSGIKRLRRVGSSNRKLVLMREEKDRFDAMRDIQRSTARFKRYYALAMSVIAFGLLWCVGAVGFWQAEQKTQGLTYFEALYFCYVSLLTIGYGDLSPTSNAGKPFFMVWSLLAVPTMTILISDMGDTVIASFKRGTFTIADWTVLPKAGLRRAFLEKHPWLLEWLQNRATKAAATRRVAEGFPTGPVDQGVANHTPPTLEDVAGLTKLDEHAIARKLALAIREVANDLRASPPRTYTYEEWAEFTHLIRFSRMQKSELEEEEEELGLIEWDWIGGNSPMLAQGTESEWVLDRLCESLDRYMKKQIPQHMKKRRKNLSMSEAKPNSK